MRFWQTTLSEWEENSPSTYKTIKSKLNLKKKAFCVRIQQYDEAIWGPVYDEYRRLGYRLCKKGKTRQLKLEM